MKGFTFIEVLIVTVVVAFLLVFTLPWAIRFYRVQQIDNVTEEVVQTLRRAQLKAMSVNKDSPFGVYFGSAGQYVLFRGNSYDTRDDEEVLYILDDISFSGISEVTFLKLNGNPDPVGNIMISLDNETRIININSLGRVNLE
jgi:prepilin-type N-terminal cleavage/methylation domain-containing protein